MLQLCYGGKDHQWAQLGLLCGSAVAFISRQSFISQSLLGWCHCSEVESVWECYCLGSIFKLDHWSGSLMGKGTGCTLQSGRAPSWTLHLYVVEQGCRLCFLAAWCLWLNSMFRQGHRQVFMVRQGVLCDQTEPLALSQSWARPQSGLCNEVGCYPCSALGHCPWLDSQIRKSLQLCPIVGWG